LPLPARLRISGTKSSGRVLGANDTIRIAVAGINGRGGNHVEELAKLEGVEIVYLIDPDTRPTPRTSSGSSPRGVALHAPCKNARRALDDQGLDALTIATPNHWHALMTIWGCQAGKDVYVEKPCSHNVREGRSIVDAARKYNGLSSTARKAAPANRGSNLPTRSARANSAKSSSRADSVTSRAEASDSSPTQTPPSGGRLQISGSAPPRRRPFHANLVHYNWHWFWDFGNATLVTRASIRWTSPGG